MGNQQQQAKSQVINHPLFSKASIHLDKKVIKAQVSVIDELELGNWVHIIHKIKSLESSFLLNPQCYSVHSRSMCGNSCILKVSYSLYPYILLDEIANRRLIKRMFQQNELWYMLLAFAEACNCFEGVEGHIGDIRPHNVLFNETGEIKIIHQYSYPGQVSNFEKTRFNEIITFLSPEEIDLLCRGKTYNSTNPNKSQAFSIGLTLLSVMCLRDFSDLYDVTFMTMDVEDLRKQLQAIEEKTYFNTKENKNLPYSSQLIKIIQRLCDPEEMSRVTIQEVYKWLLPYRSKINDFADFQLKLYNIDKYRTKSSSDKLQHPQSLPSLVSEQDHFKESSLTRPSLFKMTRSNTLHENAESIDEEQPKRKPVSHKKHYQPETRGRRASDSGYQMLVGRGLNNPMNKKNSEKPMPLEEIKELESPAIQLKLGKKKRKNIGNKFYEQSMSLSSSSASGSFPTQTGPSTPAPQQLIKADNDKIYSFETVEEKKDLFCGFEMTRTPSQNFQDDELLLRIERQVSTSRQMFPS